MPSLKYNLKPLPSGKQQIFLIFRVRSIARKFSGYTIGKKSDWNLSTQRLRYGTDKLLINDKLNKWQSNFSEYISDCSRDEVQPHLNTAVQKVFSERTSSKLLLTELCSHYINKKSLGPRTIISYKSFKSTLEKYENDTKKQVYATHINPEFYQEFRNWLINKQGNINSTINRKIKRIKTLMSQATKDRLVNNQEFRDVEPLTQVKKGNKHSLTITELLLLKSYTPKSKFLSYSLDKFLFACETGLRYSDVSQVSFIHIITEDGLTYLKLTAMKGSKETLIGLSKAALNIIGRYPKSTGTVFPVVSDQKTNKNLKVIFEDAKINRVVEVKKMQGNLLLTTQERLCDIASFHLARHTHTTLTLSAGLLLQYAQDNVGHADIQTTMMYNHNENMERMKSTVKLLNKIK